VNDGAPLGRYPPTHKAGQSNQATAQENESGWLRSGSNRRRRPRVDIGEHTIRPTIVVSVVNRLSQAVRVQSFPTNETTGSVVAWAELRVNRLTIPRCREGNVEVADVSAVGIWLNAGRVSGRAIAPCVVVIIREQISGNVLTPEIVKGRISR
jgi:hypothetical protein